MADRDGKRGELTASGKAFNHSPNKLVSGINMKHRT